MPKAKRKQTKQTTEQNENEQVSPTETESTESEPESTEPESTEAESAETESAEAESAEVEPSDGKITHPALDDYDRDNSFVAKTGFGKGANNRIEIVWPVPKTDEESLKRYGKDLSYLILHGVMELSHAPNYKATLKEDQYSEVTHRACQKLADEYKPGNRQPGQGAALTADAAAGKAAKASAGAMGFGSLEEALTFAKEAKAKADGME